MDLTSTLIERDAAAVWHPFSWKGEIPPIPVARTEGALIHARDGRSFVDAISSWWVITHGHSHPHIIARIKEQLSLFPHVIFANFTHEPAIELAELLLEALPANQEKIFFSDNGSTAVEAALKMAIQYWTNQGDKRTRIIALDGAYHGDTFGAMSAGDRGIFVRPFESFLFDVVHLPFPDGNGEATLQALDREINKGDVAAFIFEPLVQGAGGMRMYSAQILDRMLQLCRQSSVLTIADEVMTGFGRTGKLFAMLHCNEKPDIVCLSKGITAGFLALGATSCTARVFESFFDSGRDKAFLHGHSFTGNPMACAAACANMELWRSPEATEQLARIERAHCQFLGRIKNHPRVRNPRCTGTICAFELGDESGYTANIRGVILRHSLDNGVFLRPLGNTVYVMPPYCTSDEQLERIYGVVELQLENSA